MLRLFVPSIAQVTRPDQPEYAAVKIFPVWRHGAPAAIFVSTTKWIG
jgi:hypothetical protein